MDETERKITKIAREAEKFTVKSLKADGVGTAELDFIHAVRHNPGITQAGVRGLLNLDKGAAARRVASLEAKGYLTQSDDPDDGRCRRLYATAKAEGLKKSKAGVESLFYEWLTEELDSCERRVFCKVLNTLYVRSKSESRAGFPTLRDRLGEADAECEVVADGKPECKIAADGIPEAKNEKR